MEEKIKYQFDPPVESASGSQDDAVDKSVIGYALYYPLISEWEHPDGIRFDQPRD